MRKKCPYALERSSLQHTESFQFSFHTTGKLLQSSGQRFTARGWKNITHHDVESAVGSAATEGSPVGAILDASVRLKVYRWTVAKKTYMSLECAYMDEGVCVCLCLLFNVHVLYVCVTVQDKWGSVVGCVCVDEAVLVCWSGVEWCDVQVTDGWSEVVRCLRHHLQTEQKQSLENTLRSFHPTHDLNCIIFTEEQFILKS